MCGRPGKKLHYMFELYALALEAHRSLSPTALVASFREVHDTLREHYPKDWLLRWNLLESLVKQDLRGDLSDALASELRTLEREFHGEQPIASGLKYLGFD